MKTMTANELLAAYAAGERDFQNVELSGESFEGAILTGAEFTGARLH